VIVKATVHPLSIAARTGPWQYIIANDGYGNTRVGSPLFGHLLHCRAEASVVERKALNQKSER
jgi:hypothetical protein